MPYFDRAELELLYRNGEDNEDFSPLVNKIVAALNEKGEQEDDDDDTSILGRELIQIFPDEDDLGETMFHHSKLYYKNIMQGLTNVAKIAYIGEHPFFAYPRTELPTQARPPRQNMSMHVSKILRKATTNARRFKVYFGECNWDNLTVLPELAAESNNATISRKIAKTLCRSFTVLGRGDDENSQKQYFLGCIDPLLSLFGYESKQWDNNINPDFKIQKKGEDATSVFIGGEAKTVLMLPRTNLSSQLSKDLLLFGFSTKIFKESWAVDPANRQTLAGIKSLLGLQEPSETNASHDSGIQISGMAKELLAIQDSHESQSDPSPLENELKACADRVNQALTNTKIGARDALYLWGAAMQCCEACVFEGKKVGIVMSARVMWYIMLEVDEDSKCTLRISNGTYVFRRGFVGKLLRLIQFAESGHNNNLNETEQYQCIESHPTGECTPSKNGQKSKTNDEDDDDNGGGNDGDNGGNSGEYSDADTNGNNYGSDNAKNGNNVIKRRHSREHSDSDKRLKGHSSESQNVFRVLNTEEIFPVPVTHAQCSKLNANNQPGKTTASRARCDSNTMTREEQMAWQRALSGFQQPCSENGDTTNMPYLHIDKFGVAIPYLWYLKEKHVEKTLGHGRCGSVKKIKWNGGYAAMKEFVLGTHDDDDRDPYDVYEHEIKVLYDLRTLWGTCVPRLLFNNSWHVSPSIGLEVGRPMEHNFDKWSATERKKRNETIEKIKAHGYMQRDDRPSNYVCLDSGHVAMIDFEDVVKIEEQLR